MEVIVPSKIEKQILFLSPCFPTRKLPLMIRRLAILGVTVFDIQKIDFSTLHYMAGKIDRMKWEAITCVRGRTYKS